MRQLLVLSNSLFVDRRRTCGESVTQWQFSTFGSETQLSDELALRSLHRLRAVCCSRSKKGKCASAAPSLKPPRSFGLPA
jgi:hypothetical protein